MVNDDAARAASLVAIAEALVEVRLTLLGLAASPLDGRIKAALRSEVASAQSTGLLGAPAEIALRTF